MDGKAGRGLLETAGAEAPGTSPDRPRLPQKAAHYSRRQKQATQTEDYLLQCAGKFRAFSVETS